MVDPRCSYCIKIPFLTPGREDTLHLFTQCPAIAHWKDVLLNLLITTKNLGILSDSFIFLGSPSESSNIMFFNNTLIFIYINLIYRLRNIREIKDAADFLSRVGTMLECFMSSDSKLSKNIKYLVKRFSSNLILSKLSEDIT